MVPGTPATDHLNTKSKRKAQLILGQRHPDLKKEVVESL